MTPVLKNFILESKDGKPEFTTPHQKALFLYFFEKHPNKKVHMELSVKEPKRTEKQNRYLWLYYTIISRETGYTTTEIHEWAKDECLPVREKEIFGKKIKIYKSTTELNKLNEFSEFIQRIEEKTEIQKPDPTPFNLPMTHQEYKHYER